MKLNDRVCTGSFQLSHTALTSGIGRHLSPPISAAMT